MTAEHTVPAGKGLAVKLMKGQLVRVVNTHGQQARASARSSPCAPLSATAGVRRVVLRDRQRERRRPAEDVYEQCGACAVGMTSHR